MQGKPTQTQRRTCKLQRERPRWHYWRHHETAITVNHFFAGSHRHQFYFFLSFFSFFFSELLTDLSSSGGDATLKYEIKEMRFCQ